MQVRKHLLRKLGIGLAVRETSGGLKLGTVDLEVSPILADIA